VWCGNDKTVEARVLDRYPDLRTAVSDSNEFAVWRDSLPSLDIDGERLYIRGGDILRDEDQIMFEWARKNGLLSDEAIAQALRTEVGESPAGESS
jgi:hypothetical protein